MPPRSLASLPALALASSVALAAPRAFAEPTPGDSTGSSGAVPGGASGAVVVPAAGAPKPPAGPAVTAPRLVRFVQATYPVEAGEKGLEANVVLQLDVDKTGAVTSAVVIEGAGHGFDEAAVEAAKQFVFEPATRGETKIAARILYRYGFTLQKVEADPAAEAARAAALKKAQGLAGTLRSRAGDVPIAGAVVRVAPAGGRAVTVTTGEDGAFRFGDLEPGKYDVSVAAPGYDGVSIAEEVAGGELTEVVYRLDPKGGVLEVTIKGERPPREVTRRTLDQREITRIPGTNGDALRSLQNLPGVARPPSLAGLLIVRGSAPNDTQTFVDGTYVPLVYHFGGLSSVVPSELLERIDFYPGNFSSQYGRVMGGIVDVGIRSPNADGKYHGLVQVDLIDARALAEGPVPGLPSWKLVVGARRSWVDVWLKPVLEAAGAGVTTAPVYYDYQVFAETSPTSRSTLRVGLFGSDDRLSILIRDPNESDPTLGGNIGLHTGFWRAQLLYRNDVTETLRYTGVFSYGSDTLDFALGTNYFRLKTHGMQHRSEVSARLSRGVTLHTGLDLAYSPYDISLRFPQPPRPGEPDPGPYAARPPLQLATSDYIYRPAAYFEAELQPSERAKIVPGVRADYTREIGRWDWSPRVNGRYDLAHGFPRTTLKAGVGVYHQPPQFQESSPVFGSPGLRSQRATHYALGVEQELTRHVEASVEGFFKDFDSLVVRLPNESGGYDYTNRGNGYAVGAETLVKYKPDSRFFGWLAYTISRSVRRSPPDYAEKLFNFDQTHILTVLGSYKLGRGWEFGARFRLVSGNLYTPSIGGIYNADAGAYGSIDGAAFSQRLPMFHQLDLRVDKQWKYDGWSLRAYLDVQNVYNRANAEDVTYNYNFTQRSTISSLPIIPSLGLRAEL